MPNTLNAAGLALNRAAEQCRLTAYDDKHPDKILKAGDTIDGTLTIGWGHTGFNPFTGQPLAIGDTISQAQADTLQLQDLQAAETAVRTLVKVPLDDNQFGTLTDFTFNVGTDAFKQSHLLALLNQGKYDAVPGQLALWVYSHGERLQGLVARRARESLLWTTPDAVKSFSLASTTSVTPDTVRPPRLVAHLTMIGAAIAGTAPLLGPVLQQTANDLQPLIDYGHTIKIAFIGCSVGGAVLAAFGRVRDLHQHGS